VVGDRFVEVLEVFAEAQAMARLDGRMSGMHVDWQANADIYKTRYKRRQRQAGRCVSCPEASAGTSVYCTRHREDSRRRALAAYHARKARAA
jgi:hypothetical protein